MAGQALDFELLWLMKVNRRTAMLAIYLSVAAASGEEGDCMHPASPTTSRPTHHLIGTPCPAPPAHLILTPCPSPSSPPHTQTPPHPHVQAGCHGCSGSAPPPPPLPPPTSSTCSGRMSWLQWQRASASPHTHPPTSSTCAGRMSWLLWQRASASPSRISASSCLTVMRYAVAVPGAASSLRSSLYALTRRVAA